jgi:selenide,water dikinase
MRNWKAYNQKVSGISGESLLTLCDPQTNGGLLVSVAPKNIGSVTDVLEASNQFYCIIGKLIAKVDKSLCIL